MAESLLTGLVFSRPYLLFIVDVGHNFVSGICNLKPKKTFKNLKPITYFCTKILGFSSAG